MSEKVVIRTLEEFRGLIGKEVAVGRWLTVTQELINSFADATGDHQWIHVDAERCARVSPFRTTIAHGNLTLCQLYSIENNCDIEWPPTALHINYGMNKVRYTGIVPVDSRVRGRYTLLDIKPVDAKTSQLTWQLTAEREGEAKPALVAEILLRRIEF